jgi:adenylate kinase family enzyme
MASDQRFGTVKRVLVIGSPGAGKSAFSQTLAKQTGLPLIHLDDEYWLSGWVRMDSGQWKKTVQGLIAGEAWILDGNYTSTLELRAGRADHVIVLLYPCWLCMYRAITRAWWNRRPDRKVLGREPLNREFLSFIWNFPSTGQAQIDRLSAFGDARLIVLRSDREARRYVQTLGSLSAGGQNLEQHASHL